MGGPVLGFCAGRIDDNDGSASELLGPTAAQDAAFPCPVNGQCESPLGATTLSLIYVNPEGPMGVPLPAESALQVRDTFSRMSLNDSETVALIGGGHAFGKTHGACPLGPGPAPKDDPANPWPGLCGTGSGADTFTSGFEGPWSHTPTKWSNEYFRSLRDLPWAVGMGPGGHNQWSSSAAAGQGIMMLTSDISLVSDPAGSYQKLVELYASDQPALDYAFSHAWYKLTTRDMGPVTRCLGSDVPPAQPFQFPLPPPPAVLPNFDAVRTSIRRVMNTPAPSTLTPDQTSSSTYSYAAMFVQLAWQCASTLRTTDWQGGCNGARIRLSPQIGWSVNLALDKTLTLLSAVKNEFGAALSWADLIVLAGTVALEDGGAGPLPFCGGRSDAADGDEGWSNIAPNGDYQASPAAVREASVLLGLTRREWVALSGRLRSAQQMGRAGYAAASWSSPTTTLSNQYFVTLLGETWGVYNNQYKANGKDLFMLPVDLALRWEPDFAAIAQDYASNNALFLAEFGAAWTKVMNADRFSGPAGNACADAATTDDTAPSADSSSAEDDDLSSPYALSTFVLVGALLVVVGALVAWRCGLFGKDGRGKESESKSALTSPLLVPASGGY